MFEGQIRSLRRAFTNIMGERDVVVHFPGYSQVIAIMRRAVPQLKEMILLPGCGHPGGTPTGAE